MHVHLGAAGIWRAREEYTHYSEIWLNHSYHGIITTLACTAQECASKVARYLRLNHNVHLLLVCGGPGKS